ncbi:zinc ribbon domain-containing protein [Rheinheimera riviphila]|uniref:Zinc ribbon domain-containing protein n=1 Tax=Rheinheimera riviphila TaxID=1834037 RepID=A0A437QSK0_9GAMM|nr:zinc ribbon domain-containing protein [Rheinheimera riviphila]RVU37498.1 zinc ribbon domain-containing protein [Rheinheimera riviphila]
MAIINCPFCNKKASDKSAVCGNCGGKLGEMSVEELDRLQRDKRLALGQSLNNHAMMSLIIFLGSFAWYYYREPETDSLEMYAIHGAMLVGCAWYLVTKVRLVLYKRK